MRTMKAPIKLSIRQDDDAGVVRAYFSNFDGSQRYEHATLSLRLAEECPGAFEAWKTLLTDALSHILREAGLTPVRFDESQPHETN
jgi:hypothetical protein